MDCPRCAGKALEEQPGPNLIVVDHCGGCRGVWLDKGEIYQFVNRRQELHKALQEAYKKIAPSTLPCPRCRKAMFQATLPPALAVEVCAACGGNWFDRGEIDAVNKMLDAHLPAFAQEPAREPVRPAPADPSAAGAAAGLAAAALPNLAFYSGSVLASLYGLLAAFMYLLTVFLKVDPSYAFLGATAGIFINFLVGPFFMDLTLRWMQSMRWVEPGELPAHLRAFIEKSCRANGMPFPRCGLIEDGNPNAFTYGHAPSNARLIMTKGLLDMLEPAELEGVVGHELGHALHWDMLVMTLAALVPTLLYAIYKVCMKSRGSGKKNNPLPMIGLVAFLLYYVTQYIVLFLSRVRELHADRFAGKLTGNPNALAGALVKIAYGLAGRREPTETEAAAGRMEVSAARTLGIFDPISALGLVASSAGAGGALSRENILGAMQWDLWNPWAAFYELQSTHPLPARRIDLLGRQAVHLGQEPLVRFDLQRPESYWDEFFVDLAVLWLPWLGAGAILTIWWVGGFGPASWAWAGAAWSAGYICRLLFSYPGGFFPETAVGALLKTVKVSEVRGVPVTLTGRIIGRGVPGLLISEDLVLQDGTGFIFMDYRQPLAVFNWIFALRSAGKLIGQEVRVHGWYRRAPVPFFELRSLDHAGENRHCWSLEAKWAFGIMALAACLAFGAAA